MSFWDTIVEKFLGGSSSDQGSGSSDGIDYEQLDRNDSYSPYQNAKESGQAYKQYQQAYSQYQQAQRNQNEYAGWQTDDMSAANARATTENARQASESAYQNWQKTVNPLVHNTPSYTPTYQNTRNPFAAYDPAEWQISQAEGARNSPTDYLTGAERKALERKQTEYLSNSEYRQMEQNDSWNPFFNNNSGTAYFKGNQETPADPYVAELQRANATGETNFGPKEPAGKNWIDRFQEDAKTLESMYYNPVKEPQFNLGEMLKNGRDLLFPERTDEQKAAKAELDQAKFDLAHSGGSNRAAAQERLDKAQAAYDDVTKKLEKEAVTAVDNGTTGTNPKLQELYDSMSPFRRALRRFELAAEGGLQLGALATFVTTPLTAATSTLQKLAGDIPTALDIPLAARFAYQVANGKANPVKEGVGVESFTQKQWDALPESAKYQLSTIYKITNLDEFNEALKTANDLVRSNDTYKEGMSNLRDEYLFDEKIKAFHDYSQRMVDEAGYGLNKFEQFAIKLIPSGIDMAVDAVFNNWSGLAHAGLGLMADRIFGETYYDDRLAGHDHEHASAHALASAVVEVTSELIGGESVMDTLAYGNKGVFTEGIDAAIAKIGNPLMQAAAKYAAGTGSEILEEEFSQVVSPFVDALLEESPYLQTVIEKYGEQRAQEYVEAALGAILLTGVGNATGDIATSVANRAGEARGKYEAPNIDGTTTEENPNGKKAYSQTMQQVANINRNRNMDQNQLIQSIYGRAKEAGASDEQAKAVANDVYDMKGKAGKDIYNEFVKFNDGTKTREEIDAAIEAFKPELLEAEEGYVVLDADNKPVGTVKTVNEYGITIQFNDGTTESAILNGVGSGGMLDPNSRLAKVLGDNGTVVDADTADIYSRNAEQERKAQVKAGEEMQDRGEKAQPQPQAAQQPPKADTPAPHKAPTPAKANQQQNQQNQNQHGEQVPYNRPAPTPAKAQPTQQQEAPQQETPQQEQQAPTGPQFQNQDVYDNNKYEVEQSANGFYVKQPDGGLVGPFETYEQAMGMVSQFSQQNQAPQTQETQEAETPVHTQEESQPEATQEQEAPSEPEAPSFRSPLTDSITEANTVTENNGTPSKAEQYFADNPKKTTYQTTYKEAGVKIKKNADGTFTVSMASPKKNGQGWTKAVSVIGTVNSISEANQLVVDEYSKKSAPKALTDSATGTPIESPQNASESISQEESNSVLPNEQNASEVQNDELNSKPEAEADDDVELRFKVLVESGPKVEGSGLAKTLADNLDSVRNDTAVANLTGDELNDRDRQVSDQLREFFASFGNSVERDGFGNVIFDEYGVANSLNHKPLNRGKVLTLASVPEVVRNGRLIASSSNWKNRRYASYVFAAPVTIDGETVYVAAVVNSVDGNKFYINEVVDSKGNYVRIKADPSTQSLGTALSGDTSAVDGSAENSIPQSDTTVKARNQGNSRENGYTIQASREDPSLDMWVDTAPASDTTAVGGTVSAETVQDALIGKTVSEGAENYEGTLNEKQVAKLSPVQVIQRLQNYAKKARTSIKGLLKHIISDESGEALIGREAHTKQLIESSVGETRGMNAQGEYEDEVDVIGGEDDTRKERPKRSVEEAQEEVNEINRSNLMTIGDTIRDAMKAANIGRYRQGIDGICDWILDKGRERGGDAPTQAEYEAFRDLVKKMLNDEYHRQNNYKKDKKGNLVDINWKKFNTAKVLDLIDTALSGEADIDALNDADFIEINALLERAANIRVGYGETKNSRLDDVYSGYMDLRSILEGDEAFQEDLNSEIYDGTNLTAGEKWITDEDGNEVKVSDEEGWRENSKEQDRRFGWYDRGDATEGMTQAERDEYEESYWAQNGERDVANMWQQKSEQTGKGNSVVEEYLPSTSPRLSKKPGVDLPTSISGVTITQEANDLSNAAIGLISKKLREMGDLQQAINRNAQDIADIKANPSGNAVADNAKIRQHERMIESLQKRLAPYEAWASKIEGQYTINDLLNDSFLTEAEKEAFKAQLDKDVRFGRIDLQTIALNNRIASTTYYLQVGDGMFRQLLDTKTNTQLKAIVEQHEQNIKNLQRRIADNKEYVKSLNPINKALIDKYNKAIEAAENRLAREQEWLKKATGKAGSYTLNDYFADPFIRQYYADEVKGIDTETKENGVAVFGNYQFNGLRNAKSWDFANDLIKDIKKGVLSGELSEHGFNSRGEAGRSLDGEELGLGETTVTEASDYDSADRIRAGEYQAGTQTGGTERTNALLNRGGTQTAGTGTQTGDRAAAGYSQSLRTENGRQNNVGVSGQSPNAQSARNPLAGRDNQVVLDDVNDAWNKANGRTEDVVRNLLSKGYSVTTYRKGKTIVVTDNQRPVGAFSNKDGRNTRLNNRLENNPNFRAYSASKIAVIQTDENGQPSVEMKLGLLARDRKTGETILYAANVDSANHELNHDDWSLANDVVDERIENGEEVESIDELFHDGLVKALSDIGVDYETLSQYIQSFDYKADEVDEELFAELNAVMYDGSTSDWDGDTSISDIAHKLMQHEGFKNLVAQIRAYADEATRAAQNTPEIRYKQDLDQYSDESFDALVNDTSYEEASAINGQNYDQYDLNSEFNAEQASETETLNSMSGRGVDTTAAPIENFQNAEQASENAAIEDLSGTGVDTERTPIDYFQSQEQASESDLIREQSRNDLTGSEDTDFESPYEAEQRTEQEAMDSLYENMDGRKLTSPKRTANDYYGSAYARVQETQKKHKRNKARSSFSIAELYYKTYGETNDSIRNFKRLQRLNSNVDSLLDGKMSYYDFNSFAKNMSSRQGIGQILNDDIQSELDRVVALEEAAQDKNASEQDVADFQYEAANVVSHIVARMDMVEKTERARARLDTAAKKHGAKGGRKNLVGTALDAWNRYQITGDNFWRMMDDWEGKGQGYSYAREHLKTIATRISEEAKLKGYFEGIDKNSKEFKDFASGTTMSNVDFNGHKISLMEGIKFVKTVDTLRMFASENGRPIWQRVAALGGFTFEGKNGKPIFVDIQGSYDNNAEARAKWVEQRYNQLKQEIANNKAASAYMSAVEEMYYEASKDAEKVHSKVNGYDRYMYGKGWYTDIHYAKKGDGSVDFRYSDRDATDVHDTASMQRRTKVAGGYAIINPMSRSVDAYISQISNYIAFEEFGQKLGVLSDSKSINGSYANTIRDAYGDQYAQWFDNYVKSMTLFKDHKPQGAVNTALAKSRQLMMSGALVASISVPMKQVSSFFDTMGTLDPRAVRRAFYTNPLGLKQNGIKNYLMDSRNQSVSSPEFAELFGETGLLGKVKNNPVVKLARNATSRMDATTVSNVYKAAMYDVEYNNPLGKGIYNNGKNFKDGLTAEGQFYVDAKFEEALLASQPIFTPQARNELARTDDQFKRMFQTFRTQQTQNYNRALQALNEYQAAKRNGIDTKEKAKTLRDTVQGQLAASVSLAALTAIANAVMHKHHKYKDDDDEFSWEKFAKRFGLDALESFVGNGLFIGDLTKWVIDKANISDSTEFYGISAGALSTAWTIGTSAMDLYGKLQDEGWSQANKVAARYLAGNVATAMGVHANNVYNMLNAGWQWYADLAGIERKYDDIFLQWAYVDDQPQNRLVNAILGGDTDKITDMYNDMGQDKFQNAVYYGAFDKFKAGKIDKAEYVELLMNFAGKSYKDAHNEVEKKSKLLESGISQYNGIDGRDGRKAFYDRYADNFKSRAEYKQFFADVKEGKADGKHNTYYTTYNGQQQQVSANQSSIIDTMNRNIQAGNFSYETAKLLWENYYGYSTSKYSAWKFVGK